ncbi:MAG: hypothetical protein ACF8XB_21400 [Planctomycetota bacterium JB042]
MRRPGVDRILVLTGICLVTIFLGFRILAFNSVSSKELGQVIVVETRSPSSTAPDPFDRLGRTASGQDPAGLLAIEPTALEFAPEIFFGDAEMLAWRERRTAEDLYKEIAPPLKFAWERTDRGVILTWEPNPSNEAIARLADDDPLLKTGYRIYRWRIGEDPAVIATGSLEQTTHLDEDLGIRGGLVFYSVLTVLEGRVGGNETLIESERSAVLEVDLEDAFDVRLVGFADGVVSEDGRFPTPGPDARVAVEVTLPTVPPRRATFEVGLGERIGGVREVGREAVDFDTGLTVEDVRLVDDERSETVRHPMFDPDGSRAFDETGFLFREETRRIPIQRLEVRCTGDRGRSRTLRVVRP